MPVTPAMSAVCDILFLEPFSLLDEKGRRSMRDEAWQRVDYGLDEG
jgi:hypothetical protein